jgi:signal transduction histidine kinase
MKFLKPAGLMLCLIVLALSPASASDQKATREEAKAMAEKAATLLKAEGPEKASVKFQDKDGGFIDRDLYVFVLDGKGVFVAHGAKPVLVGKGGLEMKDVTGFPLIHAFMDVKDSGWVDYKWPDATDSNKIKDKSTYVIKVGEYTLGVGYYKN